MVKRVLMIAFHYPPMQGSSGIQRTLAFSHYLPRHGWQVSVLSVQPRAFSHTSADQLAQADAGGAVRRSFALDASRHLAVAGRYPALLALPDRWSSWWLSAVPAGLALIRRQRPALIWSTYPIATAHLIGLSLQRLSGVAWVADQRDPMSEPGYPPDPRTRRLHRWIEDRIAARSAAMVCTSPGALARYRERYPQLPPERLCLIENGYDEDSFTAAQAQLAPPGAPARCFRLLHSGIVYPSERDPGALFAALAALQRAGAIDAASFRLVLRASGHDDWLRGCIARHGLAAIVELAPALPYGAALAEMLRADGLLLLQAASCNAQIPAKLYEYLRAARPLLALTDPAGDSAALLRAAGIDTIARLDSAPEIAAALINFMRLCRSNQAPLGDPDSVARQSRAARTRELATLFDRITRKENI